MSRLIGSPTGYRSHLDGGCLTEAVRRSPHTLIVLDEIDKAHEKVLDVLLPILDDGRLTDGKGKMVDFSNTIIIITSNSIYNSNPKYYHVRRWGVFKPELLNRFDQIVLFKPLAKEHIEGILEIMIEYFHARLAANKKIKVNLSKRFKEILILEGCDERYGARALKKKKFWKNVFVDYGRMCSIYLV